MSLSVHVLQSVFSKCFPSTKTSLHLFPSLGVDGINSCRKRKKTSKLFQVSQVLQEANLVMKKIKSKILPQFTHLWIMALFDSSKTKV